MEKKVLWYQLKNEIYLFFLSMFQLSSSGQKVVSENY